MGHCQTNRRMLTLQDFRSILHDEVSALPQKVQREEKGFMVGSIGLCENFWEREILSDHPDKQLLLSWLQGVRIELFF